MFSAPSPKPLHFPVQTTTQSPCPLGFEGSSTLLPSTSCSPLDPFVITTPSQLPPPDPGPRPHSDRRTHPAQTGPDGGCSSGQLIMVTAALLLFHPIFFSVFFFCFLLWWVLFWFGILFVCFVFWYRVLNYRCPKI